MNGNFPVEELKSLKLHKGAFAGCLSSTVRRIESLGEINDGERSCLEMRLRHLLKETCLKEEDVVTFGMSMQKIQKPIHKHMLCGLQHVFSV